ncbi:MAG TPA: DUF3631 domain-containing protein [Rectinema sp.]|nr:DUF3631 domain-containing protein [Rectinema sp.]
MSVKVRVSKGHVFLDIYVNGTRRWESLGIEWPADKKLQKEVLRLAETICARREQQILEGEYSLRDDVGGKQTVIQYAEKLIKQKQEGPKNPLPKSMKYLRTYAGTTTIGAITSAWVEGYKDFLLNQPAIGNNTAQKYFDALKSLLRRAVMERLLVRNPAEYIKNIKVPDPQTYHLTLDELGILAKTPLGGELGAEVKKSFLFACYTGLRISDLRGLSWGDIERDPLAISIIQQKTKERVSIPLAPIAWKIIDDGRLHKANEKVFPALSQSRTNLNQYLIAWAKKAGIEKPLGFHVARRTFGTFALQYGGDWPKRARHIALELCAKSDDNGDLSIRLMADIQTIFAGSPERDFWPSQAIVDALNGLVEAPWADMNNGKGLTTNRLARMLQRFEIHTKTVRMGDRTPKGYVPASFADIFARYLQNNRNTATNNDKSMQNKDLKCCRNVAVADGNRNIQQAKRDDANTESDEGSSTGAAGGLDDLDIF